MALNILGFTIGRTPDGETVEPIKEAEKSPIVPDEYELKTFVMMQSLWVVTENL